MKALEDPSRGKEDKRLDAYRSTSNAEGIPAIRNRSWIAVTFFSGGLIVTW